MGESEGLAGPRGGRTADRAGHSKQYDQRLSLWESFKVSPGMPSVPPNINFSWIGPETSSFMWTKPVRVDS